MPEKPLAVLEQVPDDHHIEHQDNVHHPGGAARQFKDFDRDEEGRLANRQPTRPAHAEDEAQSFDQREKAIDRGACRDSKHVGFTERPDLNG
jgi:hypothetical protein